MLRRSFKSKNSCLQNYIQINLVIQMFFLGTVALANHIACWYDYNHPSWSRVPKNQHTISSRWFNWKSCTVFVAIICACWIVDESDNDINQRFQKICQWKLITFLAGLNVIFFTMILICIDCYFRSRRNYSQEVISNDFWRLKQQRRAITEQRNKFYWFLHVWNDGLDFQLHYVRTDSELQRLKWFKIVCICINDLELISNNCIGCSHTWCSKRYQCGFILTNLIANVASHQFMSVTIQIEAIYSNFIPDVDDFIAH